MKQFVYPPKLLDNGDLEYKRRKLDWRYPPVPTGYEADPQNQWLLLSLWEPCEHREITMYEQPCGAAQVVQRCACGGCQHNGRVVRPEICETCPMRKGPNT